MIKRYVFGSPIETDSVLCKPEAIGWQESRLQLQGNVISCELKAEEIVYGLGQNVRGINKRGWIYESNCVDEPQHTESKMSLYGAHNFLILDGEQKIGIFVDTPAKVTFDIGYTDYEQMRIVPDTPDFELYVIEEESLDGIVSTFRKLIGRSYIPPLWAFGYGQSRWGYDSAEYVREVAAGYRDNHIPIDSIYLDIDYMERYKDFTVNEDRFPDFEGLVRQMREQGIHLVPIIDGGVKKEDGYDVYEEGKKNGYFCKDAKGEDFVIGVWPGRSCLPDMLNEEAGRWFAGKYKILLDKGIDGFWNDMNEPAIFYSEKGLKEAFDKIDVYRTQNLDVDTFFAFQDTATSVSNSPEDYAAFYHQYKGKRYCHQQVHNLFGYYMTRRAGEAFEELSPDKRILLFSRASCIGMHRYGGVWQGDNSSWWSHLLMNIRMMPSLNMCGFLYTGADLGGFGNNTTEDLLIRWLSFGVFTPLMRNHSVRGTRKQEVYCFRSMELMRDVIGVRYQLLPYLYSEYMKAALLDKMMFRPLGFVYEEDQLARRVEDQLMLGDSIMIAPVYEQNVVGRTVYIPEPMKLIRFHAGQVQEEEVYQKGFVYVEMPLGDVCVFLKENHILPLSKGGESVEEVDFEDLKLYCFGENVQPYAYYMDDGESKRCSLESGIRILKV